MARPTEYSQERGEHIAKLIKAGNYSSQAAQAAGVSESTCDRVQVRLASFDAEKQRARLELVDK